MRRLALALLVCLCDLGSAAAQPPSATFQIDITQSCEVVAPAACNGGIQRFTISAQGTRRATLQGAQPARAGNIDRAQLSALQSAVSELAAAGAAPPSTCA